MTRISCTPVDHAQKSYQGILKSTALLGSARLMTMVIGMARVKVLAVLIGPIGIGLIGTYEVLVTMAFYIFGLGVQASGVRQVAIASSQQDAGRIARTMTALRRLSWSLGLLGSLVVGASAWKISSLTFKDPRHGVDILILSPAILLTSIYSGGMAIVQGCQRIADLAKITVLSSIGQAVPVVVFVYFIGERGIAWSFVAGGSFSLLICRWIIKGMALPKHQSTWASSVEEGRVLIKLGLGLTNALLLSTLLAYAVRSLIARDLGLEAVGIYLCAYGLSGKFIGFLLDAMQTDFYPRLSAVAHDHEDLNRLVNQQTEIVLLMAMPGLLATLAFAPWLIRLFYSGAFAGATVLLRWFILGCLVRVIYAPIAFVQLAKGRSLLYFLSEAFIYLSSFTVTFFLLKAFGLRGAAASYLVGNLFQTIVLLAISRRLTGFKWSSHVVHFLLIFVSISTACVLASFVLSDVQAALLCASVAAAVSLYCMHQLAARLGPDHRVSRFLARFGFLGTPLG